MNKRDTLINLLDFAIEMGDRIETALTGNDKDETGTYETWSPKDTVAHVAVWLSRDIDSLGDEPGNLPVFDEDALDAENRKIFAGHREKSWEEIHRLYRETFSTVKSRVAAMTEEELCSHQMRSDGSGRPVWRVFAGHALMHPVRHFAGLYVKRGEVDRATQLAEKSATLLAGLDDSREWRGNIAYNLACHYTLIGQNTRAVGLLKQALADNPDLADWSRNDPDLDSIRTNPEHASVFE